jgi:hypothetical protein
MLSELCAAPGDLFQRQDRFIAINFFKAKIPSSPLIFMSFEVLV